MGAIYKAKNDINVNNNYGHNTTCIDWIVAFGECCPDSLVVFDRKKRVIFKNNRFGTLDGASDDDVSDLFSLSKYYANFYYTDNNWIKSVLRAFDCRYPQHFEMINKSEYAVECRAYPVISAEHTLGGVVWLAHRNLNDPGQHVQNRDREYQREHTCFRLA